MLPTFLVFCFSPPPPPPPLRPTLLVSNSHPTAQLLIDPAQKRRNASPSSRTDTQSIHSELKFWPCVKLDQPTRRGVMSSFSSVLRSSFTSNDYKYPGSPCCPLSLPPSLSLSVLQPSNLHKFAAAAAVAAAAF